MTHAHLALAALLWARNGRGLIASSDIASCAAMLPNGTQVAGAALAHALVSEGLLIRSTERAWSLSPQAIEAISFDAHEDDLSLTPDEERQLFEALQQSSRGGRIEAADVHAVTRRFLEEALAGAMIPDELLDRIVEAYRANGRLTMTEDGGRYILR